MKHCKPQFVLCLMASVWPLAVAGNVCSGQTVAANRPLQGPSPPRLQRFVVEDVAAAASADPQMGWSELPAAGRATPPVPISRTAAYSYAPAAPVVASTVPGSTGSQSSPTSQFVGDENVAASLHNVALEAAQLSRQGMKMAAKGAVFSSRTRLIEALELIADARDARNGTQFHSRALTAGLVALREADDFSRPDVATAGGCDPVLQAAGHSTPVIKHARRNSVTRLQALQLYYSYATSQLAAAVGGVPEASMALYYLGRLQPFLGASVDRPVVLAEPKALALQQAAVLVDSQNYRAANELGVLLANCGQLESSRKALLYSASLARQPEILQNLAIIYKRLGDNADAASIAAVAAEERRRHPSLANRSAERPLIYLVDHKTFAGESSGVEQAQSLTTPSSTNAPPPAPAATPVGRAMVSSPAPAPNYQPTATVPLMAPGAAEIVQPLAWDVFAQGEYIGPARTPHVPEYYLRVDDQIGFVFRLNGKPTTTPYRLNVGDVIRIGSQTLTTLTLDTPIQPDGTIILPQVGAVTAAGKSIETLRIELDQRYRQYLREPAITVIPLQLNRTVQELIAAINNRSGIFAGQAFNCRVSPDGTVQLPAIGAVPVQGLTIAELRNEVESRYAELVQGIDITPVLRDRAPRSVYVLGEVQKPGNYPLNTPTTVIQAIALAGSWNIGGNLRQVIVFRRDEEWRLMATRVNVRPALYNYRKLQADDIWLRDNDIVIVPKCPLQVLDDYINLFFTKGVYGVVPFNTTFGVFENLGTLGTTAVVP